LARLHAPVEKLCDAAPKKGEKGKFRPKKKRVRDDAIFPKTKQNELPKKDSVVATPAREKRLVLGASKKRRRRGIFAGRGQGNFTLISYSRQEKEKKGINPSAVHIDEKRGKERKNATKKR